MAQAKLWAAVAVPIIVQSCWRGAAIYRVEDEQHPACVLLDRTCGIDWLVEYRGLVKGLSVRCQARRWERKATFTIRDQRIGRGYSCDSELEKTIEAERTGAITAAYQLHAYMDVDEGPADAVVRWGLAKRVALFQWIKEHPEQCGSSQTQDYRRQQIQTFPYVRFSVLPTTILVASYPAINRQGRDTLATIAGPR